VQALLAYLVLQRRRSHPREVLTGLFWGDHPEARARSCLSTALWRLRRVLEPPGVSRGTYLVTSRIGEVGFNCNSEHWVDVAAFEQGVQRRMEPDWSGVESAISHYTGDLLEGFYEDWALRERERLRILYLDALGRLLRHHSETDDVDAALACGQRILEIDPLREEIHRELIRLHLRSGHRAHALRQYQSCRDLLASELGIEPMEETRALNDEILSCARPHAGRSPPAADELLPPLRSAASGIDEAREHLTRAIRLLDP
jgi:DNA-binding SARP family transcriptional activator